MYGKKSETKFTIQFSQTDPAHLRVADVLNRQERHGKARYIVEAVMHFLSCDGAQRPAHLDEKYIEAVVSRMLRESGADLVSVPSPAGVVDDPAPILVSSADEIIYSDAIDALGEDGINAVAGALDMFRKK